MVAEVRRSDVLTFDLLKQSQIPDNFVLNFSCAMWVAQKIFCVQR